MELRLAPVRPWLPIWTTVRVARTPAEYSEGVLAELPPLRQWQTCQHRQGWGRIGGRIRCCGWRRNWCRSLYRHHRAICSLMVTRIPRLTAVSGRVLAVDCGKGRKMDCGEHRITRAEMRKAHSCNCIGCSHFHCTDHYRYPVLGPQQLSYCANKRHFYYRGFERTLSIESEYFF